MYFQERFGGFQQRLEGHLQRMEVATAEHEALLEKLWGEISSILEEVVPLKQVSMSSRQSLSALYSSAGWSKHSAEDYGTTDSRASSATYIHSLHYFPALLLLHRAFCLFATLLGEDIPI